MKTYKYPSVLTIAGFDGSGGAGLQADIKTISALGCYATSVLTSLPVQNTTGVKSIYPISVNAVADQIDAIFEDITPDAIKIGMVHTPELVDIIVNSLKQYAPVPIVYDPVMIATSGHKLIEDETIEVIIKKLFPISTIITPNMDEAGVLANMKISTVEQLKSAGKIIASLGSKTVLLKGGHQTTDVLMSYFIDENNQYHKFQSQRINTKNLHGSGCTLSSAIASYIAQGKSLYDAVDLAQQYVFNAIDTAKDVVVGKGNGPLNHFFNPQKLIKNDMD